MYFSRIFVYFSMNFEFEKKYQFVTELLLLNAITNLFTFRSSAHIVKTKKRFKNHFFGDYRNLKIYFACFSLKYLILWSPKPLQSVCFSTPGCEVVKIKSVLHALRFVLKTKFCVSICCWNRKRCEIGEKLSKLTDRRTFPTTASDWQNKILLRVASPTLLQNFFDRFSDLSFGPVAHIYLFLFILSATSMLGKLPCKQKATQHLFSFSTIV